MKVFYTYMWIAISTFIALPAIATAKIHRLPEFLLVGAQKSGTTVLYDLIKQHPKVVKKVGEVHFFDLNFFRGIEWYKKRFPKRPHAEDIVGDHSPYYLFHPLVPKRVHAISPKMKIIMILRNPVERCYSHYWHNRGKKLESLTFENALEAEPKRLAGEKTKLLLKPNYKSHSYQHHSYLARGIYVEQIQNWLSYFPQKQMLILRSQDLRRDPVGVLNKVYAFLGLPQHTVVLNNPDKHSNYPPITPEMREKLEAYYLPFNQKLEELLGMQFDWD